MRNIWQAWGLLWRHLRTHFGREAWLWAGLLILTPVTEGIGVFLILPLFQAIGLRAEGEAEPPAGLVDTLGVPDKDSVCLSRGRS